MSSRDASSQPPLHFSMLRGYNLADFFTLANAWAGTASILLMLSALVKPELWRIYGALGLLPIAFLCDMADGRIARARQAHSAFGRELDSLADIISFGVAPVTIGYGLGLRGSLDALFLLWFVGCGVSRLARFNLSATTTADTRGAVSYFEGLPIPSSLFLIVVFALCLAAGRVGDRLPFGVFTLGPIVWHPFSLLYFIHGCAMISKTLRIPKW